MRVTGPIARVAVTQEFLNPTAGWLEGVYVFPLPEGAAVDAMRLQVGARVIEGQIREREEARQVYHQAQQAGKKASLLEQERPNIFTISVANVGPGEAVVVDIEYQEVVRYDQGEFRLRFPMVVGPRYIPGTDPVPGTPGHGLGRQHDRGSRRRADHAAGAPSGRGGRQPAQPHRRARRGLRAQAARQPVPRHRDDAGVGDAAFDHPRRRGRAGGPRLRARVGSGPRAPPPAAAVFTEWHAGEPYALVMLLPPAATDAAGSRLPREVIFVVDTSGSMAGASIQQARLALDAGARRPGAGGPLQRDPVQLADRAALSRASVPAGPAEVERARRWVQALQANGGTEMLPALRAALESDTETGVVRQVVFVTDGLVGNEDQLFAYLSRSLGRSRLFTVGIGAAPNGHFMTKAAQFGRGTYTYIGSPSEVGEKMGALFRKLEHPVLGDVAVELGRRGRRVLAGAGPGPLSRRAGRPAGATGCDGERRAHGDRAP